MTTLITLLFLWQFFATDNIFWGENPGQIFFFFFFSQYIISTNLMFSWKKVPIFLPQIFEKIKINL